MFFSKSVPHLIYPLKFLGYFSYDFENIESSFECMLYSWIINVALIIARIAMYWMLDASQYRAKGIFLTVVTLEVILGQLPHIILHYFSLFEKKQQIIFFKLCRVLERQIQSLESTANLELLLQHLKRKSVIEFSIMTFSYTSALLYFCYNNIDFGKSTINIIIRDAIWFFYLSTSAIHLNIVMLFIIALVRSLESFLIIFTNKMIDSLGDRKMFLHLIQAYQQAEYAIEIFSQCHGIIIISMYLFCFGSVTFEIFHQVQIKNLQNNSDASSFDNIIRTLIVIVWLLPPIYVQYEIGCACDNFEQEINRLYRILQENSGNNSSRHQIIGFNEVKFHCVGLLHVDGSWFFKVGGFFEASI